MKKKDCTRLRRLAERDTAGKPDRTIGHDNRGCRRLSENCTRGLYQRMKRAVKRGEMPFARVPKHLAPFGRVQPVAPLAAAPALAESAVTQ